MLSTMQKRLRDEYDIMNEDERIKFSYCGDMISYETYEDLTRLCCMSVEDVYENYDLMDWER